MNATISKEKIIHDIINNFDNTQIDSLITMLESVKALNEREDMEFCNKLYEDYLKNSDSEEYKTMPLEEYAKTLGINLNEL